MTFTPTYDCMFTDEIETKLLEIQESKQWLRFCYIDDICLRGNTGKETMIFFS